MVRYYLSRTVITNTHVTKHTCATACYDLDRGFLYGSIVLILIWNFAPGNYFHLLAWSTIPANYNLMILIAYTSVVTLFVAGELDRHDKSRPQKSGSD